MALIYTHFGFDGLLIVTTATLACLYTWLLSRLLGSGLHILSAGLIVALFIAASSHHFHVRPHSISIAFLALTEPGSSLDRYFTRASGWRLEKQTPAASFYRRADG